MELSEGLADADSGMKTSIFNFRQRFYLFPGGPVCLCFTRLLFVFGIKESLPQHIEYGTRLFYLNIMYHCKIDQCFYIRKSCVRQIIPKYNM